MDKSWIDKPFDSSEFVSGFTYFLSFAIQKASIDGRIRCPCRKCYNRYYKDRNDVVLDVMRNGFLKGYKNWVLHGEPAMESFPNLPCSQVKDHCFFPNDGESSSMPQDDMRGLLHDALRLGEKHVNLPSQGLKDLILMTPHKSNNTVP